MPRLEKCLKKLGARERQTAIALFELLARRNWRGLDLKKLKGYSNVDRVRKGNLRVIFQDDGDAVWVLSISRRSEKTYKDL